MMKKFSHHYQMAIPNSYDMLKDFARKNKNKLTPAEEMLWNQLRKNDMGVKFRRQHIIGDYIVDFVCLKKWLVIEVDGKYRRDPQRHGRRIKSERTIHRINNYNK